MDYLFDRNKPHFTVWIWINDPENDPWESYMSFPHPEKPRAPPLYYAALHGLRGMVERHVVTYPQNVNARSRRRRTPLHAAVQDGHSKFALALLENGADMNAWDET